jgi:hypothetical protein
MISERLGKAHHVVARFNPWGFSDADEMFGALADAVLEAIGEQGDEIKKLARKAERLTKAVQKGVKVAGQATKHAGDLGVARPEAKQRLFGELIKDAGATLLQLMVYLRLLETNGLRTVPIVTGGWDSRVHSRARANRSNGTATHLSLAGVAL